MACVGLLFEICQAETLPGETVCIVGSAPELGAWEPRGVTATPEEAKEDPLQLRTGALRYPCWSMSAPLWIRFEDEMDEKAEAPGAEGSSPSPSEGASSITLGNSAPLEFEYKFLKVCRSPSAPTTVRLHWEDSIGNRHVTVPREPGAVWLVSDAQWNCGKPPSVSRLVQADLALRCGEIDIGLREKGAALACGASDRSTSPSSTPSFRVVGHGPNYAISTPQHAHGNGNVPSFAIDDEFEALTPDRLPILLAEKLTAEKTASELASEVMRLQKESAMLRADKDRAEEDAKEMRGEVAHLKEALLALAQQVEAASTAHAERAGRFRREAQELQRDNDGLRQEAKELSARNSRIRHEISKARTALAAEPHLPTIPAEPHLPTIPNPEPAILSTASSSAEPQAEPGPVAPEEDSTVSTADQQQEEVAAWLQEPPAGLHSEPAAEPGPGPVDADEDEVMSDQNVEELPEDLKAGREERLEQDCCLPGLTAPRSMDNEAASAEVVNHELQEDLLQQISQARSTLGTAAVLKAGGRGSREEEAETELMKVLRQRRERIDRLSAT